MSRSVREQCPSNAVRTESCLTVAGLEYAEEHIQVSHKCLFSRFERQPSHRQPSQLVAAQFGIFRRELTFVFVQSEVQYRSVTHRLPSLHCKSTRGDRLNTWHLASWAWEQKYFLGISTPQPCIIATRHIKPMECTA